MDLLGENGWFSAVLVIFIVFAAPFVLERTKKKLTHVDSKNDAFGSFARLSQGTTHFKWVGPTDGKIIVAVHGLSSPAFVWSTVANGLAKLGYRVLVYDLYGRGYSEVVDGAQNRQYFITQLKDLVEHENVKDGIVLMGYSMGGSIVTAFAAEHSKLVRQVVLLAPAGMCLDEPLVGKVVRLIPVFGDWLHHLIGAAVMKKEIKKKLGSKVEVAGIIEVQLEQFDKMGFLAGVLSGLRYMLQEVQEEDHRTIARANIPVVAVWGAQDTSIPIRASDMLRQWNSNAHHEIINDACHGLTYTHSNEVVKRLKSLLV